MIRVVNKTLALALLLVVAPLPSYAAMVSGTDVDFFYDDTTLFGVATAIGNSIFFQPTAFEAKSENGAGAVLASETLIIDVVVRDPGAFDMTSFAMVEQGDYIQNGVDASVSASGRLGVTSTTTPCGPFSFPCMDASIFNVTSFVDTGGATLGWSGGATVDLADTAGWGADTAVEISFQNNLSATTLINGELAFIQKKFGGIGLVVNPVPLPAAVWLFGCGLIGLIGIARRKKA